MKNKFLLVKLISVLTSLVAVTGLQQLNLNKTYAVDYNINDLRSKKQDLETKKQDLENKFRIFFPKFGNLNISNNLSIDFISSDFRELVDECYLLLKDYLKKIPFLLEGLPPHSCVYPIGSDVPQYLSYTDFSRLEADFSSAVKLYLDCLVLYAEYNNEEDQHNEDDKHVISRLFNIGKMIDEVVEFVYKNILLVREKRSFLESSIEISLLENSCKTVAVLSDISSNFVETFDKVVNLVKTPVQNWDNYNQLCQFYINLNSFRQQHLKNQALVEFLNEFAKNFKDNFMPYLKKKSKSFIIFQHEQKLFSYTLLISKPNKYAINPHEFFKFICKYLSWINSYIETGNNYIDSPSEKEHAKKVTTEVSKLIQKIPGFIDRIKKIEHEYNYAILDKQFQKYKPGEQFNSLLDEIKKCFSDTLDYCLLEDKNYKNKVNKINKIHDEKNKCKEEYKNCEEKIDLHSNDLNYNFKKNLDNYSPFKETGSSFLDSSFTKRENADNSFVSQLSLNLSNLESNDVVNSKSDVNAASDQIIN